LRRLRELDPGIVVFTNQAHRSSQPIVAEADWDMTESAATSHAWGPRVEALDVWGPVPQAQGGEIAGTFFRGWPGQWGIEGIHRQIEARLLTTAPREGFVYLDYMRPLYRTVGDDLTADLDIEAVYYSYCAAALWGRAAFCSGWFAGREYDGPLYFADLGEPLGDGPRVVSGVAVREYERGLIALATEAAAVEATYRLAQCEEGSLYDLFSGRWLDVRRQRARIALAPSVGLSGTPRPSARVYLKTTRDR